MSEGVRPLLPPGWKNAAKKNAAKKNGRAHLGARSRRMRDHGQGLGPTGYKVMRTTGSHERHRAQPRISRQHLRPALDSRIGPYKGSVQQRKIQGCYVVDWLNLSFAAYFRCFAIGPYALLICCACQR